jgi:hypothetical protein
MRDINKLRLKIASIPLFILIVLIISPLPLYFIGIFNYFAVMPLITLLSAFIIFFIGAWWDFGAKEYLKDLMVGGAHISEADVRYINKQQFIITIIYILIGIIYIMVAYILSLF